MNIRKEDIPLDKYFPFMLMDQNMPPNYNMDRKYHWHDCLEISYVKKGNGRYHIEGKTIEIKQGDIIIINNIEPHYLESGDEGIYQPVIVFDPVLIWSESNCSMDFDYLKPFFERGSDFNNKLDSTNPLSSEIMKNLMAIEEEYNNKPEGYRLMIKARLLLISTYLTRYFRNIDKTNSNTAAKRMQLIRLEKSISYIKKNFNKDIKLSEVASQMFMSPQYFSSYFKSVLGVNFREYINNIRANYAIKLLKDTNKKITHIAMECGFNNTANFNLIFKKYTGKTPSEYRQIY